MYAYFKSIRSTTSSTSTATSTATATTTSTTTSSKSRTKGRSVARTQPPLTAGELSAARPNTAAATTKPGHLHSITNVNYNAFNNNYNNNNGSRINASARKRRGL